jgi:hypothetical protein
MVKIDRRVLWLPDDVRAYLAAKAPYRRSSDEWDDVEGPDLRPADVIDLDGSFWHVQIIRPNSQGYVSVRVSPRRLARTGVWRTIRAGVKVKRLRPSR